MRRTNDPETLTNAKNWHPCRVSGRQKTFLTMPMLVAPSTLPVSSYPD
jgi:hypothetical protein